MGEIEEMREDIIGKLMSLFGWPRQRASEFIDGIARDWMLSEPAANDEREGMMGNSELLREYEEFCDDYSGWELPASHIIHRMAARFAEMNKEIYTRHPDDCVPGVVGGSWVNKETRSHRVRYILAPDPELIKRAYDFVEFTRPSDGVEEWCSDAIDLIDALTGALEGRRNALTGGDDG